MNSAVQSTQHECLIKITSIWQYSLKYKQVGELARALLSFKQPSLSVDVMVGMYDSVKRYPPYLTL